MKLEELLSLKVYHFPICLHMLWDLMGEVLLMRDLLGCHMSLCSNKKYS